MSNAYKEINELVKSAGAKAPLGVRTIAGGLAPITGRMDPGGAASSVLPGVSKNVSTVSNVSTVPWYKRMFGIGNVKTPPQTQPQRVAERFKNRGSELEQIAQGVSDSYRPGPAKPRYYTGGKAVAR